MPKDKILGLRLKEAEDKQLQEWAKLDGVSKQKIIRRKVFKNGHVNEKDINKITALTTQNREQIGIIMKHQDDNKKMAELLKEYVKKYGRL